MNDAIRFGIMSLVSATFPMLAVLGVVQLSAEQTAAITAFITQLVLLFSLIFRNGQEAGTGGVAGRD